MGKLDFKDLKGSPALAGRSPFARLSKEPVTRDQIRQFRNQLTVMWEDTLIVTFPNGYRVISVGNLIAILDALLLCKDFDNPQLMMGETP